LPKIYLSNGRNFPSETGESILAAAMKTNVAIEYSCKNGRCGVCVAPVLSGETEVLQYEEFLAVNELPDTYILTCCREAVSDVTLDIEDLEEIGSTATLTLPCKIASIERLNDDVVSLILRLPPRSDFSFVPGQYINLIHSGIRRSYSLANALRDDGKLELQIKKVHEGVMSEYLFSHATQNDLLRLEGPLGTFSYRPDTSENIVFLATGTGIAPIKAILEGFNDFKTGKSIYVVWGGSYKKDLYLKASAINGNFTFVPVVSREERDDCFYGYVQDAVLDLGLNLAKSTVYACGSEVMIRDARALLCASGLEAKRFYSDAFISSS
jgi:CDP-4-dehydro-6-deoxyglucose reductase, E3